MYQPRNPHTPSDRDRTSLAEFRLIFARFQTWQMNNPVVHQASCDHPDHKILYLTGFCCLSALKSKLDLIQLEKVGHLVGLWPDDPEKYNHWLSYAWLRLQELEEGRDHYQYWTNLLSKRRPQS